MKYVLVIGASHAGKSATIGEICKRLNPEKVWRLKPRYDDLIASSFEEVTKLSIVENGTFVIQVEGIGILVSAGSPTEQGIQITVLFSICLKLNMKIELAIVAMRSFEKKDGFDTKDELCKLGDSIYEEKIYKIPGEHFKENLEWKSRIERIMKVIEENYSLSKFKVAV